MIQAIILIVFVICSSIYGFFDSKNYTEITPLGNTLISSSSLWFLGLSLFLLNKKPPSITKKVTFGFFLTIVLPPINFYCCGFLMLLTGQVSM